MIDKNLKKKLLDDLETIKRKLEIDFHIDLYFYENRMISFSNSSKRYIKLGLIGTSKTHTLRTKLVHEAIHQLKIEHNPLSRRLGYYSGWERDELSPKVEKWIFEGGEKPYELDYLRRQT